jgi:hypothetical protein
VTTDTVITDEERANDLPDADRISTWLGNLLGCDRPGGLVGEGCGGDRTFRIEAGFTVEVLVTEGGAVMLRTRNRAWGVVMVEHRLDGQFLLRPRFAVAARLEGLDLSLWPGVLSSDIPEGRAVRLSSSPRLIHFDARSSATLVEALVRALHGQEASRGTPVGPAWKVLHDPRRGDAPFRATFDDAGFPTREDLLADGRHVVAVIGSEGWLRRASFRDPPAAEVSCPVVETAGCTLADGLLVTDVRIHPVRPSRWMIEGIGFRVESGAAVHPVGGVGFLAAPDEMVRRCVGAVGPPMVAANGAITPGLTFDGLELVRS